MLSVDEDQLSDSERSHSAEQVAYVAFAPAPPPVSVEFGTALVGSVPSLIQLDHSYQSPVVVCSVRYANNTVPVVARVSFKVRLQNPSGASVQSDQARDSERTHSAEQVAYFAFDAD